MSLVRRRSASGTGGTLSSASIVPAYGNSVEPKCCTVTAD
jgi:hypothetical protein